MHALTVLKDLLMNTSKTLNIHGIIHSFISSKTILDDILCKYFSEKAYFDLFPVHYIPLGTCKEG